MTREPSHELRPEQVSLPREHAGHRLPLAGALIGVAGLGLAALLAAGDPKRFFFSYLTAFLFFLSLALGAVFFVLVQHVTRAGWSVVVRRFAENVMGTLPVFALLFIPVALGIHDLYHWSHAEAVATDPLLQHKQPYLNTPFFLARAALYLVTWSLIGWWFRRLSLRQDASGSHEITRRLQRLSAPALIPFALTLTFAAFDWLMSLDPHWYSTIFGVYFFSGAVVGIFALLILMTTTLDRARLLASSVTVEHLHDLGKLLFAFVAFWAYIAFSQYFLIWYANIPEETAWFLHRWQGSWEGVSLMLGIGHFVIPFFFLLPRTIKRSGPALVIAALWLLVMHYLDIYWLVLPTLQHHGPSFGLMDLACVAGVGGVFLASVSQLTRGHPLIPLRDPRLPESLAFENI